MLQIFSPQMCRRLASLFSVFCFAFNSINRLFCTFRCTFMCVVRMKVASRPFSPYYPLPCCMLYAVRVNWSLLSALFVCLPFLFSDWLNEKLLSEHPNNRRHCSLCVHWHFVLVQISWFRKSRSCDEYHRNCSMYTSVCMFTTFDLFRHFGRRFCIQFCWFFLFFPDATMANVQQ